jgi:hypothetical protein
MRVGHDTGLRCMGVESCYENRVGNRNLVCPPQRGKVKKKKKTAQP